MKRTHWGEIEGVDGYVGVAGVHESLEPGIYKPVSVTNIGLMIQPLILPGAKGIVRFPDSPSSGVVDEIERFWERGQVFDTHDLPHKRGVLLWGPPGSGKSMTLRVIALTVVDRGGVVFVWSDAFIDGYRLLRDIEPERSLVVMMEDIDSIITPNNESKILNALDGIEAMHRVVFIASTNYPEKLADRIVNRPSRFDRKILIEHPEAAARELYLSSLVRKGDKIDVARWMRETDGFSIAHLKELFVATVILGNSYEDTLRDLRKMKERATSLQTRDFAEATNGAGYA